jgi:formylglycine-generating enzyme required for sulfatase activity
MNAICQMKIFVLVTLAACTFEGRSSVIGDDDLVDAGPSVSPFPSCVDLAATCGPSASDDCCSTATPIPGGTFYRSYDVASDGMFPNMAYPATVSAFHLDKYEVTVGRFRAFLETGRGTQANAPIAGAGAHAKITGSGWDASWNSSLVADTAALRAGVKCDATYQTWTDAAGANENLPINCVTWYEAFAFCAWDGGFPPTEAEWNFAAAGGDEQRAYPWSSPAGAVTIDHSYANFDVASGVNRVGSESPKGDGKWGHADLGGNVDEWVLDWFAPYEDPCDDCANLADVGNRVVHGSDWANSQETLRTARRNETIPVGNRDPKLGVRCARP